MNTRIASF
jgi:hypothetical protein